MRQEGPTFAVVLAGLAEGLPSRTGFSVVRRQQCRFLRGLAAVAGIAAVGCSGRLLLGDDLDPQAIDLPLFGVDHMEFDVLVAELFAGGRDLSHFSE